MPQIISFDREAEPEKIIEVIQRDGVVIIKNAVEASVMDDLVALFSPSLDSQKPGGGEFFGYKIKSISRLFARGPDLSKQLLLHPQILALGEGMLGSNSHHFRVHAAAALQVWDGGQHQPLHREMDVFQPFIKHDPKSAECIIFFNWAGSDFTIENGATRLVPGSHKWARERRPKDKEVAQAVMPKGSFVAWLGKTYHGLGASQDKIPRTGIGFSFVVNWLTQEENQFIAVPPEKAKLLPEKAQQLLGYRASPILGWVSGRNLDNLLESKDETRILNYEG